MNRRSDVAAVLCIAGPTLRRSFELPVKHAQSFDRPSNVPGLMISTDGKHLIFNWLTYNLSEKCEDPLNAANIFNVHTFLHGICKWGHRFEVVNS